MPLSSSSCAHPRHPSETASTTLPFFLTASHTNPPSARRSSAGPSRRRKHNSPPAEPHCSRGRYSPAFCQHFPGGHEPSRKHNGEQDVHDGLLLSLPPRLSLPPLFLVPAEIHTIPLPNEPATPNNNINNSQPSKLRNHIILVLSQRRQAATVMA